MRYGAVAYLQYGVVSGLVLLLEQEWCAPRPTPSGGVEIRACPWTGLPCSCKITPAPLAKEMESVCLIRDGTHAQRT